MARGKSSAGKGPAPGKGGGGKEPPAPSTSADFRRFVLRFLGSLLLFSVLSTAASIQNHLGPLEKGLAAGTAWGAGLVHLAVQRRGNSVAIGSVQIEINHECTAFFVLMIYASFLLAYPATMWERLRGFLQGVAILMSVNLIRLIALAIVMGFWPMLFDYFHEYFWQVLFLGLTTVLAHRWLSTLAGNRELLVFPR